MMDSLGGVAPTSTESEIIERAKLEMAFAILPDKFKKRLKKLKEEKSKMSLEEHYIEAFKNNSVFTLMLKEVL